ncbi:MAG: hypothetical protein IAG13_15780, partial [Deltaproteobacteria bacterium]|nr:hypothetical protein [Nannocystaceae bacterium]
MGKVGSTAEARARGGEATTTVWTHPFAELRAAVQRKPSAWLELLRVGAGGADPLLLARIPAVHRKLTAAGVPHVLPLLGVERDGDRLVLVHRHERGESLAQRLARGPLPLVRTLELLREVCRSIAAAHRVGIEHRVLGPASVWLGERDDELWIIDFAIADLVLSGFQPIAPGRADVALHPMTPERAAGGDGSGREDVYLIGCLAHWMICGHPPFAAADLGELARRHASEPAPALDRMVAAPLPFSLIDAVARALHKDPEQRYPDVDALARVLAQAQREAGVEREDVPRAVELPPRQTHPFGTDPPRPIRPRTRTASLRFERLPPTMVITAAERAALPSAPRHDAMSPMPPAVAAGGARGWIALGVIGIALAIAVVLWPVDPAPRQWDADAGRRVSAEQPVRAAAALPT